MSTFFASLFILSLALGALMPPAAAQAPAVRSFAPLAAPAGALIHIEGRHFTGATFVSFSRVPAQFVVNSDTQITAQVPKGDASGTIQVTAPGGIAVSAKSFTLGAPKVSVTALTPALPRPGTLARLSGLGFTSVTAVKFGGKPARFTVASDTQISVLVPLDATPSPVSVTTPYGSVTLK